MQAIGKHKPMLLSVVHLKEAPAIVRRGIDERMSTYQPITEGCQLSVVSCHRLTGMPHADDSKKPGRGWQVRGKTRVRRYPILIPECLGTYKGKGE